jgi:hypothetical protein
MPPYRWERGTFALARQAPDGERAVEEADSLPFHRTAIPPSTLRT